MTIENLTIANLLVGEIKELKYQLGVWDRSPALDNYISLLVSIDGTYTISASSKYLDFNTIKSMAITSIQNELMYKEKELADL